jgi:hypothetical protein
MRASTNALLQELPKTSIAYGLAAVCHFFNSGKVVGTSYTGWDALKQNEERVKNSVQCSVFFYDR